MPADITGPASSGTISRRGGWQAAALVSLLLVVVLIVAGCSKSTASTSTSGVQTGNGASVAATASGTQCPTSNTTAFAKTQFVLHAGLGFGAFHRYIYKPFKAGAFQSGARGRIVAFGKAGVAALFIKREVRLASDDVKANPTLCKLIATPLQDIADHISGAVSSLKGGDVSAITGVEQTLQSVEGKAASADTTIQENANAPLS